ncbi:MAG: VanZ family protein [Chloroflexi bacterium]|nr:VanZ family protein [Chloroflexota bacterium]
MKRWAIFFGLVILAIIVLADEGRLGFLQALYDFPYGDKAGHFILFGLLGLIVNLSVFEARPASDFKRLAVITSLILALLIGLEELSQIWFPKRTFDLLDLAASYLGVALFAWLAVRLKR